jgi:hypothetical protein
MQSRSRNYFGNSQLAFAQNFEAAKAEEGAVGERYCSKSRPSVDVSPASK